MKKLLTINLCLVSVFCFSQTNNALQFNGTSSYVEIMDNNAIDLSADFTIEAWIYPTGPGSDGTQGGMIINKENSYEIARFADGTIQFALSANGAGGWAWTNTGAIAPQDQWSQIALVKSGTSIVLYMNGVSVYSDNSQPATLNANTYNLRFGTRSIGTLTYFNGDMDEVRIWNTARTQAEVKANMFNNNLSNGASGLEAYYRMNEGSGTSMGNSCTNTTGINGTLYGGTAWTASPVQFAGNALKFNGSSNYVELTNRINVGTSDFTIEAWVYPQSTSAGMVFAQDVCGDAEQQFRFYTNNSKVNFDMSDAAALGASYNFQLPSTSNSVPLNTWTHIAVTRSGNNYTLYINGVSNATYSTGANTINNQSGADVNKRLRIGARGGVSSGCGLNYFNGMIDEVRFWNVARTATDIQQNYTKEIDPSAYSDLAAYYTFDQGIAAGTNTGITTLMDQKGDNNGTLIGFSLTGSTSNFVAQNSSFSVLPLTWLSFAAQKQNEAVLLQWKTAAEINISDFVIEHSTNGTHWQTTATVLAKKNENETHGYYYLHRTPSKGINYYRIRQNDKDGRFSYSKVISIDLAGESKLFRLVQNPVINKTLQFEVHSTSKQTLRLLTGDGKMLWSREFAPGLQHVDISSLLTGVYFLQCEDDTEKLIIE